MPLVDVTRVKPVFFHMKAKKIIQIEINLVSKMEIGIKSGLNIKEIVTCYRIQVEYKTKEEIMKKDKLLAMVSNDK